MKWQKNRKHTNEVKWHGWQRSDIVGTLGEGREMSQRQYLKNNSWEFYYSVEKEHIQIQAQQILS